MTEEELNTLPAKVQVNLTRLEEIVREVLLDLGPLQTEDLLQEIACNIRSLKFTT